MFSMEEESRNSTCSLGEEADSSKKSRCGKPRKESAKETFLWEDDEVELLLSSVCDYKAEKTMEGVDWESIRKKYEDILKIYLENVPSEEECKERGKSCPHGKNLTKDIVATKLKAIRLKYREAVDNGRRSGHGRVVQLYYEVCERIWGGSPATEQISGGMESFEVGRSKEDAGNSQPTEPTSAECSSPSRPSTPSGPSSELAASEISNRRHLLDSFLQNHRQEKLKRKANPDAQLLALAQEDLNLKKKFLGHMTSTEEDHKKTMDGSMTNMSKLTDAITARFGLLQQALGSPQPTPTNGSLLGHFQSGSALPMQAHSQGMQPGFTPNFNYPGYSSTGASSLWQKPGHDSSP